MWRDESTAQTRFTAKKNSKKQRKAQPGMFALSVLGAEPARYFSSGVTAILSSFSRRKYMNADEDRRGSNEPWHSRWEMRFTGIRDLTEFAAFAEHRNS
jgi:hypothetical protein